jgi:hypothetical protein
MFDFLFYHVLDQQSCVRIILCVKITISCLYLSDKVYYALDEFYSIMTHFKTICLIVKVSPDTFVLSIIPVREGVSPSRFGALKLL